MQEKIYCHICNTQTNYSNWNYFIDRHIKGKHKVNLTKDEYCEKYNVEIKNKKEKIKCLICGEQTDYVIDNFYQCHVKINHPELKSTKDYYDECIRKDGEGICPVCGKETEFKSYYRGYRKYCSLKCSKALDEYREKFSETKKKQYEDPILGEKIRKKYKETCLLRFGVDSYVKTEEYKNRIIETNLNKYGVECTLYLDHVKEARNRALEENKEEINEKRKAFWTNENIERVNENRKNSNLEKYGVESVSQLEWVVEKQRESTIETCRKKYGVDNVMQVREISEKMRETNTSNLKWVPWEDLPEFIKYRIEVENETRKYEDELFENWNGLDYYTGEKLITNEEYAKLNPNVHLSTNPLQPSIDHKISRLYGFLNNIDPKIIGSLENLCICSRSTNSSKNSMCEEEFLEKLNNRERNFK